ncbi:MAG: DUF6504 family protein, partial [Candidatus Nanopelagicales bacterium]
LAHWVETGAWWRVPAGGHSAHESKHERDTRDGRQAPGSVIDPERQLWRVEACRGSSTGVFDLCHDTTGWSLRGVHD